MRIVIGFDEEYLNFYSIDNDSNKLEFVTKFSKTKYNRYKDMMK